MVTKGNVGGGTFGQSETSDHGEVEGIEHAAECHVQSHRPERGVRSTIHKTWLSKALARGGPPQIGKGALGVSEELLRGRDLHAQPIETTQAVVGRADLDDMWTIWNTSTPEERRLIIDLARQVVGRMRR
jgi:hypothetical protein